VALLDSGPHDPTALTSALRAALSRLRQPRLFGERDGALVCFLHARDGVVAALARRLVAELVSATSPGMPSGSPRLAVGRCSGLSDLALSHQQAREALAIAQRLDLPGPVVAFDELGLLHWLWALPPATRTENSYAGRVRLLAEYDQAKGAGLLATLEAYLRHAGAVSEAAAALGVHRHTLTYRLDKIEKICEIDLAASLVRLNLQVALLEYRLHG
jgi:purine catabolism regulator